MDIRKEIRNILLEVFNEAASTEHFEDRVFQRLTSSEYTRPSFNYNSIKDSIDLVKKINFDPSASFAILLKTFKDTFVSKDPETGKPSIGNEVWLMVRDNEIRTIFFRNSSQKGEISTRQSGEFYMLNINVLKNFYDSTEKNPDGTVDFNIRKAMHKTGPGTTKKRIELDMPVIELDGQKWFVDIPNETLIYTKNIKKTISINDLDEKRLEKVIDSIEL